ncbi:Peptidoglycan-N-acetylglucosamine deacetylase [Lactococcus lactis]|nr:Peptidoglycan-N-acetylglucosamine deacetylase [Lactococcus lactis]
MGIRTVRVLDELIKRQIPATFMIWGEHMVDYPEIMKAAVENELFAFGNHTYHHRHLTDLSDKEILSELNKTDDLFYELTGEKLDFVRPPFGDCEYHTLDITRRPLICWSLDTMSWNHGDPAKCFEAIHNAKDGDIVLMHDFQEADVFALSSILDYLEEEKFTFKSIPELLGAQLNDEAYIYYSRDKRVKTGFGGS